MPRKTRSGPPRYSFGLNPYRETRFSKCPKCEQRTHPRKFVLFIHVDGTDPIILGKTCRFCTRCQFIIVHQDELEQELAVIFERQDPAAIGNEYRVLGTVDKKAWQRGLKGETPAIGNMSDYIADFEKEYDLHYDPGGWSPA